MKLHTCYYLNKLLDCQTLISNGHDNKYNHEVFCIVLLQNFTPFTQERGGYMMELQGLKLSQVVEFNIAEYTLLGMNALYSIIPSDKTIKTILIWGGPRQQPSIQPMTTNMFVPIIACFIFLTFFKWYYDSVSFYIHKMIICYVVKLFYFNFRLTILHQCIITIYCNFIHSI